MSIWVQNHFPFVLSKLKSESFWVKSRLKIKLVVKMTKPCHDCAMMSNRAKTLTIVNLENVPLQPIAVASMVALLVLAQMVSH